MNIPIKDLAVRKCPFQNRRTVLRSRHSLRLDLEDAAALFGKGIPIIRSRHTRLRPLFAEGIVILAVEVFAACRRHLRHDTCTAQMIRQEIVHLRVRAVVRTDDPTAAERGAFECPVIIYQRTYVPSQLAIVVSAHLDLRTVGKIGIVQSHIPFGINHRRQVK